jgi:hypothetical protein
MRFGSVGSVAMLVLMIPGAVRADGDEGISRPLLVIRTYNTSQVSRGNLRIAQDSAAAILKDVASDVQWLDCGVNNIGPIGKSPRCGQTLASNELILRILTKGEVGDARNVSMGFSTVGRMPEDHPILSTVFADVVAVVAGAARVDATRLLGYAIAHEIGHLLLNSAQHSNGGLMRALWSSSELKANTSTDWVFLSEDAERMRQTIAARQPALSASSR